MVFSSTFNNISVISRWSVLLVEDTRVPRENHRPDRYLDKYERVYFHGEDPNKKEFDDDNDHAPARKKVKLPLFGIPLSYNQEQHKVTGQYYYLFFIWIA
jgi:hypothetical protein